MKVTWSRHTTRSRPGGKNCSKCNRSFGSKEFAVSDTQVSWLRGEDEVEFLCFMCTPVDVRNKIKLKYKFENFFIPLRMMGGIDRYIKQRIQPGEFLTAVICNNLKETVGQADEENMRNIPAYVSYFYNEAPADCWGSSDNFLKWLESCGE